MVSSPDAPDVQQEFAEGRGWNFRMVSIEGTSFAADLGMKDVEKTFHYPGISSFQKDADGNVMRVGRDYFTLLHRIPAIQPMCRLGASWAKMLQPALRMLALMSPAEPVHGSRCGGKQQFGIPGDTRIHGELHLLGRREG